MSFCRVKLFYSALDEVAIHYNENSFIIIEYVTLGINNNLKRYPLEKRIIHFSENGNYNIASELLFEPPQYDKKALHHIYNANNTLISKLKNNLSLSENEKIDVLNLPSTSLILKLNNFTDAKQKLIEAKPYIKRHSEELYQEYKEVAKDKFSEFSEEAKEVFEDVKEKVDRKAHQEMAYHSP